MTLSAGDSPLTAELTLELARLSIEPEGGDKSRNLALLRSRLGLPTAAAPAGAAPATTSAVTGSSGALNAQRLAGSAALAPWQQWLAVGVLTGTLGFYLGRHFERPPPPAARAVLAEGSTRGSASTPPPVAAPALSKPEATSATAVLPQPASPQPVSPQPVSSQPVSPQPARVAELTSAHAPSIARRSNSPAHHSAKAASAEPAEQRSADFLQAVQLLGRARRALDRGEPALSLALLDELDRRFVDELLDEERGATRVLGLCANGEQPAAVELAQRLFSGRPRSIYTRRIERSCAGEALSSPPAPRR